ncbi:DUF3887 domain-containing protein [bacterium]|nr:DUF3887 domain-containing protein [bacterium]
MRSKRILSMILLICIVIPVLFLTFSTGCAKRGNIEPDYSAAIAENILMAMNKSDYDSISQYFDTEFKDAMKKMIDPKTQKAYATEKDAFINAVCKPLIDKIGEYQQGTLKFDRTLTEKGYTSVFYKTQYSKEKSGDVTIQFVFKDENGKMMVSGLWASSKILQQ